MPLNKPFSLFFLLSIKQHKLEGSLLALGQFQHALAELMAWLTHTEELLDSQRPINGDPKVIEVELAKHHVSARGVCVCMESSGRDAVLEKNPALIYIIFQGLEGQIPALA